MMLMDLAATMRSSVATTHNIPLDAHNLHRWHGYNVDDEHTTDGNTGHLTTTTTLLSTSPTAAIAAAAYIGFSKPSPAIGMPITL